jgi:aminoacyl tRNA synthase complex-interacting multifunctional protein 1
MTKVTPSSAVCTLTVASGILEKDVLLAWVVNLASDKQLKVTTKKKGNDLSLTILDGSSVTLTQRNAILRAISGFALHNALDNAPYYLLGGQNEASRRAADPAAALTTAAVVSWMSLADSSLRSVKGDINLSMLDSLNEHLASHSFLVPSAAATLSDLDLALALNEKGVSVEPYLHVVRWMRQCHAVLSKYADTKQVIPDIPSTLPEEKISMSVFFYGNEDFTPPAPRGAATAGSNEKKTDDGRPGPTEEQKKAAAEEKAKKAAEKQKKTANQPQQQDTPLDVSALEIRVGKIIKAWHHQSSDKLFCEEVDVGEDKPRSIASGLRAFYQTEDLQGRLVLVLCNLKSRNLAGFPSHGMVLCASNNDHTKVEFVVPPPDSKIGERAHFQGIDPNKDPEPENKVNKKKMFEKLAPDLKTDSEGFVVWKEHKATTSAGPIKALNGMAGAQVS